MVTARAVAPMEKLRKISWPLLLPGGSLLAIKGESAQSEADQMPGAHLHEITLEGLPLGRVISLKKSA
ncbi:MAG: RsmG family class I SAM-dependent methyltransferase [Actinomycetota bacterium]